MTMHPSFHALSTPDKPAFIMAESGEQLSYAELERDSNRGAQLLRQLGLQIGDHVAVMIENCTDFVSIAWAVSRAGLYFTPLSTSLQKDEIDYIVENCEAKVFIASATLQAKVDFSSLSLPQGLDRFIIKGTLKGYSSWEEAIADQPAEPIADECEGLNMLYSSGTTGRPKGIKQTFVKGPLGEGNNSGGGGAMMNALYGASKASILLVPAPLYHAAPLIWGQIFMRMGATLVVMEKFDPENALKAIQEYRVTHSQWVPTMFIRMLKLDPAIRESYDVSSLQCAVHSAAPCPIAVKEQMMSWWGPIIYEYYAGSEGAGMTAINPEEWLSHKGSVGRPFVGEVHIVDDKTGEELPPGEVGMIYFGGGNKFAYHGDEEKTRATRHPKGWSTMGDLGYVDEDGFLYLSDRKDFMIISGGVNIYPQESENLLVSHPKVIDVAVIGVPHEEFGEAVKAVVQPDSMDNATLELAQELIDFCRANISAIKSPRSVDFVPELPRTPTGKLLKRVLKEKYAG